MNAISPTARPTSRSSTPLILLTLALLGAGLVPGAPLAQANQTFGPVQIQGGSSCPNDAAATIQAGADCANAGATVFVSAGTYNEQVTVNKALTICSHVGGPICALDVETGHWQKSATSTWQPSPGGATGQSIHFTGVGTTSLFTADGAQVDDVFALSYDFYLAAGACGAGSPRFALGVDVNGDGARDKNVFVYSGAGYSGSCSPNSWRFEDYFASPTAVWDAGQLGGPQVGTQAQARAAAEAAANANGFPHEVVVVNFQWDRAPGDDVFLDNVRVNDHVLAEAPDEGCFFDASQASCRHLRAAANTVVASSTGTGFRVLSNSVTIRGLTVQVTGDPAEGATNGIIVGTLPSTTAYANVRILDNVLRQAGGGESGVTGRLNGGLVAGNELQGWRQGVYLRTYGPPTTVEDNVIAGNGVGILTYGEDPLIQGNRISGSLFYAIGAGNVNNAAGSQVMTLRDNVFRDNAATLNFRPTNDAPMHVDGRFNDWGAYSRSDIEATFQMPGSNTVDTRCYRNAADTGYVCPPTAADFTASPNPAHWSVPVQFTDASALGTSTIASQTWNFGDGSPAATGASVAHTFPSVGTFSVTHTVTDTDGYSVAVSKPVTTTNTLPTIGNVPNQFVYEGSFLSFSVAASDSNGDGVVLSAAPLPSGATFTQTGAVGTFRWTPTHSQAGAYPLTLTAADGQGSTSQGITITVYDAPEIVHRISVERIGSSILLASPGETLPLRAVVRNLGTQSATVVFTAAVEAGWTATTPAAVILPAGGVTEVAFSATVPAGVGSGNVELRGQAGSLARSAASWSVEVPIRLTVALDDATPSFGGTVSGTITARFVSGAAAPGASVTVRQTPPYAGTPASSASGTTGASGTFAFALSDLGATLPGWHGLDATATLNGRTAGVSTNYEAMLL